MKASFASYFACLNGYLESEISSLLLEQSCSESEVPALSSCRSWSPLHKSSCQPEDTFLESRKFESSTQYSKHLAETKVFLKLEASATTKWKIFLCTELFGFDSKASLQRGCGIHSALFAAAPYPKWQSFGS